MIKSILFIIALGAASFTYTDIHSSSIFYSIILPLFVFISLVALGLWFVVLFYRIGINQTSSTSGGDGVGIGGFDGGDGGGC
ncbi:MAG: hypothetical protein GY696_21810 [Gammaproteobacteria bacterium]|nr:hypothetical protein [Gammaproteobacteria bacterium]